MTSATDIEQQASEWIIRSESGNFTDGMRDELEQWLRTPRHRVTYLRIKEAWRRAGRVRSAKPLDGPVDPDLLKHINLTPGNVNKPASDWTFRIASAAALTLIIYLTGLVIWVALGPSEWIRYTTSVGGYEQVTLADGTGLQLNTDTEIRARLTKARREVQVVRGEVLLKVAGDQNRPFMVSVADASLRTGPADAASFTVRLRDPRSIDVAVIRGIVILGPSEHLLDAALGNGPLADSELMAGAFATVRSGGVHLAKVALTELDRRLSWTVGLLSFQGETLAEVTTEFNRYNRKHLIVTDPAIAGRRIGGAFQATDPESFVSALQKWFGVRAIEQQRDTDSTVIRLSSAN